MARVARIPGFAPAVPARSSASAQERVAQEARAPAAVGARNGGRATQPARGRRAGDRAARLRGRRQAELSIAVEVFPELRSRTTTAFPSRSVSTRGPIRTSTRHRRLREQAAELVPTTPRAARCATATTVSVASRARSPRPRARSTRTRTSDQGGRRQHRGRCEGVVSGSYNLLGMKVGETKTFRVEYRRISPIRRSRARRGIHGARVAIRVKTYRPSTISSRASTATSTRRPRPGARRSAGPRAAGPVAVRAGSCGGGHRQVLEANHSRSRSAVNEQAKSRFESLVRSREPGTDPRGLKIDWVDPRGDAAVLRARSAGALVIDRIAETRRRVSDEEVDAEIERLPVGRPAVAQVRARLTKDGGR